MSRKPIIPPVEKALLKAELNQDTLLRTTNRAGNELYVVGPESKNVIREIGRLREIVESRVSMKPLFQKIHKI